MSHTPQRFSRYVDLVNIDDQSHHRAQERGHTAILLKGMGRAINKTVTVGT